jgi:hypothetical protein
MIRDIIRTACAIAAMTIGAGLVIETRYHMAAIDVAHRSALGHQMHASAPQPQPVGRLRSLGKATLELADAALGIVR